MDIKNDVFISFKNLDEHSIQTRDAEIAAEVYTFLTGKGLSVFLSSFTLEQLGAADHSREIDSALESAIVLLAIGTSAVISTPNGTASPMTFEAEGNGREKSLPTSKGCL